MASIQLNKGVFNSLRDDFVPFFKYVSNPKFRQTLRNHPDLASMANWVDVMTRKHFVSTLSAYDIPVGSITRATEWSQRMADWQYRYTGADWLAKAVHIITDHGSQLTLSNIARKAAIGARKTGKIKLSRTDRNILSLARLSVDDAIKIGEQLEKYGSEEAGARFANFEKWDDGELAFRVQAGANNVTMNSILLPGTEVPEFVKTPFGELMFQFKKFIFAGVDRCLLPAVSRLSNGEAAILGRVLTMVAMGGFKEQLGRLVDGKEPLDWDQFWEVGIGKSDVLPFIGDLYKNVVDGFHSRGVYGAEQGVRQFVQDFFLPPALGVVSQWPSATVGWSWAILGNRDKISKSEANAMKGSLIVNVRDAAGNDVGCNVRVEADGTVHITSNRPFAGSALIYGGIVPFADSKILINPMEEPGDIMVNGEDGAPSRLGIGDLDQVLAVGHNSQPTYKSLGSAAWKNVDTSNGLLQLDSSGLVPANRLPVMTMNYRGTFGSSASTTGGDLPTENVLDGDVHIADSDYSSTVAGTTFLTGQWAIYDDVAGWDKIPIQHEVGIFPVGGVIAYAGQSSPVPANFLPCDGYAIAQASFPDLFAAIGTIYNTGGEGYGHFRVPNYNNERRFLQGATVAGYRTAPGLPNITGSFGSVAANAGATPVRGAFYYGTHMNNIKWLHDDAQEVLFDASRCNAIYGAASTVQPMAQNVIYLIRYR
jgi:microcystin-dependent protein